MSLSTPRASFARRRSGFLVAEERSLARALHLAPYLQEMPHPQHASALEVSPSSRMSRSVALQQTTRIAKRSFIQTSLRHLRGPLSMQLDERAQQDPSRFILS